MGLLSVIMLGLLMMFNQTERVFRSSMTQVDVLESGRVAARLLARELEQITPCYQTNRNFFSGLLPGQPLVMPLPGNNSAGRTNLLEDVFLLTRENLTWTGIGYFVRVETNNVLRFPVEPVYGNQQVLGGQLYRFEESLPVSDAAAPYQLYSDFFNVQARNGALATNSATTARVADGVVHFKVRAYDPNGVWLTRSTNNILVVSNALVSDISLYQFRSNAVPASVEFELGLLEDRVWERYKSLPVATARYNYLTNQVGRVHVFRQRVAVRCVDPSAYQ